MKRIVTGKQMKNLDERTILHHKIDSLVLMERAALSVVKHLEKFDLRNTLVVCGSGNNGGDGIAIARLLHLMKKKTAIYFAGNQEHKSDGCAHQMEVAGSYGVRWINNPDYSEYTTIVDALFGVGLSRTITGTYADIIEKINQAPAKVVSVDIPSGVNADNGRIMGCAVQADLTVTFAYEKAGQLIWPGKGCCGTLVTEDIGIYQDGDLSGRQLAAMDESDLGRIPVRLSSGNKGTFGKVLLIAGSKEMPGASILCGQAVMRTGAGMLKMVIPEENRNMICSIIPEAMLAVYASAQDAIAQIEKGLSWADVVILGPGIGTGRIAEEMTEYILKNCCLPLVIDADGLNIVSRHLDWLKAKNCSCILTPHVGEMARLLKIRTKEVAEDLLYWAQTFAKEYQVQCVLKDAAACIALPAGTTFINKTGNCGMATAGSGDVLTGIIGGLLAVGTGWEYAGALGAWLHGAAGDRIKEKYGTAHLMAGDIIDGLSDFCIGEERGKTDESV